MRSKTENMTPMLHNMQLLTLGSRDMIHIACRYMHIHAKIILIISGKSIYSFQK